ncbi:hypothetical protein [Arthrobacter sp. MP_2.3]|uniref:hypothetical protein n=1 Tax=Arthrobacter sp. MP_2.3 TaxID=3349633 RepID=UPI0038D51260
MSESTNPAIIIAPADLVREHLGQKVQYQRIDTSGHTRIVAVLESVQHSGTGYKLEMDSGTTAWGSYDDGATVQFLPGSASTPDDVGSGPVEVHLQIANLDLSKLRGPWCRG